MLLSVVNVLEERKLVTQMSVSDNSECECHTADGRICNFMMS
jgi:hypothetical protein